MKGGRVLHGNNRLAVALVLRGVAASALPMRMLRDYWKSAIKRCELRTCRRMMAVPPVVGMSGCRVLMRTLRTCSRGCFFFNRRLVQRAKGSLGREPTPRQCEKPVRRRTFVCKPFTQPNRRMMMLGPDPVNVCLRLLESETRNGFVQASELSLRPSARGGFGGSQPRFHRVAAQTNLERIDEWAGFARLASAFEISLLCHGDEPSTKFVQIVCFREIRLSWRHVRLR